MSIKPEIITMSKVIGASLTSDKKEGTIVAAPDVFEKTLPETLTMETVNAVREHNTTFVAAGAHAFGTAAIDLMSSNKKLDRVAVEMGMGGKDSVAYTMDRSKTTTDHLHGKGEIIKYGVMTTVLENVAGKNAGQLKAVRKEMGEIALAQFAK